MLHLSRAAARAAGPLSRRRLLSAATTPAAQAEMLSAMVAQLNNDSTRASTNAGILEDHGADESWHASVPPDVVVWPESTAEVSAVVKTCAANGWAVTPYGVGTALEGHVGAMKGGVTIDTTRMASVLEINAEDMDVRVQAGITRKALNTELRHTGLYFPIDPGADATLGGMASCGASGTAAVKFGTMKESTLGLTVVTADGSVVNTGTRARKSAAGYDLTRLMVGSEGTLGVITELSLKLAGTPAAVAAATCHFADVRSAVETVVACRHMGVDLARAELLDAASIVAINAYSSLELPVAPTLFFEFHGLSETSTDEQSALVQEIAGDLGASGWAAASGQDEMDKLWAARHSAYYASLRHRGPNTIGTSTDVCVPISELADSIARTSADLEAKGLFAPIFGHVGDGNYHVILSQNPSDPPSHRDTLKAVTDGMLERALAVGGTCTGEHGVGRGKMAWLEKEAGPAAIGLMQSIKRSLDPQGIMNPGKVLRGDCAPP